MTEDQKLIERARAWGDDREIANQLLKYASAWGRPPLVRHAANRLAARAGLEEWMEIESDPPVPGQRIVAATPDGSRWHFCEAWFDDSVDEWTDVRADRYIQPTHWRPLPPAPEGK